MPSERCNAGAPPWRAVAFPAALVVLPAVVDAHEGHGLAATAIRQWTWDPIVMVLLTTSATIYVTGLRRLWARAGRGRGLARWQAAAFGLGLFSIAVAQLSPVAWLSDVLFSVHMTQHEILMLISAPLIVLGQPLVAALWVMPRGGRERARQFVQLGAVAATWRAITGPVAAFFIHAFALWTWHIPALYQAALAHYGIHLLQHACFLLTALLFWWAMAHGRYGRMGYGLAVLYVFLTAVHSSILGALMTFAPSTWYPAYERTGAAWQVNALEDQQLAGLLMWVPAGAIFGVFALALFAAWLGEAERRAALGHTHALALSGLGREMPSQAVRTTDAPDSQTCEGHSLDGRHGPIDPSA